MSRIGQRLRLPALAFVLAAAAACTSVPADELSVPLPTTTTTVAPASDDAPDLAPESEAEVVPDLEALPPLDVDGTIAIGGLNGLVLADPADGSVRRNTDPIGPATQPTWSRDGSRAVSYIPSADGGSVVVITATPSASVRATSRPSIEIASPAIGARSAVSTRTRAPQPRSSWADSSLQLVSQPVVPDADPRHVDAGKSLGKWSDA